MRSCAHLAAKLLKTAGTLSLVFVALSLPLFAVLGEDVSSVRADGVHMNAAVNVLPATGYSIHEMRSPEGIRVREFVSAEGQVFGVSWQGPRIPDLRQLLGEHFDEYVQAAQNSRRARGGGMHIEAGDLVFESGGHMGFFVGRAYLRSKLPDGATADAIQ